MIRCGDGEDCPAVCDFCKWYNFNGGEYGCYTGDGKRTHHQHPRGPTQTIFAMTSIVALSNRTSAQIFEGRQKLP